MTGDRSRLRTTFDEEALLYDAARPGYPDALFEDAVSLSGIPPGGRILEIGCGTGQATSPFARRGYSILCVELGENLAAVARRNLAPFPGVEVVTGDFESWTGEEGAFDLATSATALHWIDPSIRYRKLAGLLKPGGAVAPFWYAHVHTEKDRGFFEEVQQVHLRVVPEMARGYKGLPRPEDVAAEEAGRIEETGLYGPVAVRRYPFDIEYYSESYVRLLNTHSDHRSLAPDIRERLFEGIAELIRTRYGGRITKGYLAMLYVAHRK